MALKDIIVRPAQPTDKEAVLDFCQHTWANAEDYIVHVWDRWMAEPFGQILVAELMGQLIAMTRVVQLSEQEGWWEAIRVDPKYRGQGLMQYLDREIDGYFLTRGITTIRCCVARWNVTIPEIIQRRGYHLIADYLEHSADAINTPLKQLHQLKENDLEKAWQLILQLQGKPPLFVCRGAKWQILTMKQVQQRLEMGKVWGYRQNNQLEGVLIQSHLESADSSLWVGYAEGTKASFSGLVEEMKSLAFPAQISQSQWLLPKD